MKLITLFLLVGILAVSGWAENYSPVLVKRAEAGDAESQYFLGTYYYYGGAVIQDYKEAVEWFTRSAKKGNANAQFFLGLCYHGGQGVRRDCKEAVKWYTKAAEQRVPMALINLADIYYKGDGVTKDYKEAVKWYTKVLDNYDGSVPHDGHAAERVANCYYNGWGVTQDYKEAVKWYTVANSYESPRILGDCYYNGWGVTQDYEEAAKWYMKAPEWDVKAQMSRGECYLNAKGGTPDYESAGDCYVMVLKRNNDAIAQYKLGLCYAYGQGPWYNDKCQAYDRLAESAKQGNADAKKALHNLKHLWKENPATQRLYEEFIKSESK